MGFLRYRGARRCRGWMAFLKKDLTSLPKDLERPSLISWWNDEWGDNISSPRAPETIRNSKPSRRCFTKTIPDVSVWPHSLIQHIWVASIFKKTTFGMRIPKDFLIFRGFFQRASPSRTCLERSSRNLSRRVAETPRSDGVAVWVSVFPYP